MSLYSDIVLDDEPEAYWRLGTSPLVDATGHGRTLTAVNAAAAAPGLLTGDADGALDFDGVDDRYTAADIAPGATGFTIEAWIKPDAFGASTNHGVFSKENEWLIRMNGNAGGTAATPVFHVYDGVDYEPHAEGAVGSIVPGSTYHVVGVFDAAADTLTLYVNGVAVNTIASVAAVPNSTQLPTIGAFGAGEFFNGKIDEVAYYLYALTADQVLTHYDVGKTLTFGEQMMGPKGVGLYPTVKIECAFPSKPTDTYQRWQDLTGYVIEWGYERVRQHELDRFETSRFAAKVENAGGEFYRDNADSPFYPNVKATKRLRVRVCWNGVRYHRWAGFSDDWAPRSSHAGKNNWIALTGAGPFKQLNLFKLDELAAEVQEQTGTRILNILDYVGGPIRAGAIAAAGVGTVAAVAAPDFDKQTALSAMQAAGEAEQGQLFERADGRIEFQDRQHRIVSQTVNQASFGAGSGELPFLEADRDESDGQIVNDVRVTRTGGVEQTAEDATSISEHFRRTREFQTIHSSDAEAAAMATFVLSRYKDALTRFPVMKLAPARRPAEMWPEVLDLEVSERITVVDRPPGVDPIGYEQHVEGVSEEVRPGSWLVTLPLSPADPTDYWILGTSTLGVNTTLSW